MLGMFDNPVAVVRLFKRSADDVHFPLVMQTFLAGPGLGSRGIGWADYCRTQFEKTCKPTVAKGDGREHPISQKQPRCRSRVVMPRRLDYYGWHVSRGVVADFLGVS